MNPSLSHLLDDHRIWCARQQSRPGIRAMATGYRNLDGQLNGQGLPRGAVTECLLSASGIGELRWLVPLMQNLCEQGQMLFWVNPPWIPYAPALQQAGLPLSQLVVVQTERPEDQTWTLEQILRSPETGMLLAWPRKALPGRTIRRLQLAAEDGDSIGMLMQPEQQASKHSLAALRLQLKAADDDLLVHICKQRGGHSHSDSRLPLSGKVTGFRARTAV